MLRFILHITIILVTASLQLVLVDSCIQPSRCKDERIQVFFNEAERNFAPGGESGESPRGPFQLSLTQKYSTAHKDIEVELSSNNPLRQIAELVVQACDDDGSGGHFVPDDKSLLQERDCDSVLLQLPHPRKAIRMRWNFTQNNRPQLCFRFAVFDNLNQYQQPTKQCFEQHSSSKDYDSDVNYDSIKDSKGNVVKHRKKRAAETDPSAYVIFANRVYIHQLSLDGTRLHTLVTVPGQSATAIDYHYRQEQLYWSDVTARKIMRSNLDGSAITPMLETGLERPNGIAIDWINDKLYWADTQLDKIGVLDLTTKQYTTLIDTGNGTEPSAIVVDPQTRKMYWSDRGSDGKIEKASMDGKNRTVIHNTSLVWLNALTIDYSSQILYWADGNGIIESSNVDGSNRKILAHAGASHPFAMTVFENVLYFTDGNGTGSLSTVHQVRVDATGGNVTLLAGRALCIGTFGIEVVSHLRQPLSFNPCKRNNHGDCSHLCLLSSVDVRGYTCACPDGMVLDADMLTCSSAKGNAVLSNASSVGSCTASGFTTCCTTGPCHGSSGRCYCDANCHLFGDCCSDVPRNCAHQEFAPYLIFTNKRYIHLLSLGREAQPRIRTPTSRLLFGVGMDYHYRRNLLFWTDFAGRKIWQSNIDGSGTFSILSVGNERPGYVAVDWISDKIYWTKDLDGSTNDSIEVYDLQRGYRRELVSLRGTGFLDIVVDPRNRHLYWSSRQGIERASMDGTNRSVIHQSDSSGRIWGLAIDHTNEVLYWSFEGQDMIEGSSLDGTNRRVVLSAGLESPFDVVFYGDSLYFSDSEGIHSFGVSNTSMLYTHYNVSGSLCDGEVLGIQIIGHQQQIEGPNPCGSNNGGCSELCLLSSTDPRGYSCACHKENILHENGRDCITGNESLPVEPVIHGTCAAAGHTGCCSGPPESCRGNPPTCSCDANCELFRDCCSDALLLCGSNFTDVFEFLDVPQNQSVLQFEDALFSCSVQSFDLPSIEWWFTPDGSESPQLIADESGPLLPKYSVTLGRRSMSLLVRNVEYVADSGEYTCIAHAASKTKQTSGRLTVLVLPTNLTITGSNDVGELQTIDLTCSIVSNPEPEDMVWLKRTTDEVAVLVQSPRIKIRRDFKVSNGQPTSIGRLLINTSVDDDSGEYVCAAKFKETSTKEHLFADKTITVIATDECLIGDQGNTPCQNGGVCTDLVNGFACSCRGGYQGKTCDIEVPLDAVSKPTIKLPPSPTVSALNAAVNLTCTAEGHPAPMYEWYRDDELLPGETLPYLYIPEALPEDRANYTCKAINEEGETVSERARLDISGVLQYDVDLEVADSSFVIDEILLTVAISPLLNVSSSVYTVKALHVTMRAVTLRITIILEQSEIDSSQTPQHLRLLRNSLHSALQTLNGTDVIKITRYDGCESNVFDEFLWPETNLGSYATAPCPCAEIIGSLAGQALRLCEGTYSHGARWNNSPDYSHCTASTSQVTNDLCLVAKSAVITNATVDVAQSVANITSEPEKLSAVDISLASSVVHLLTDDAATNPEVRDNYLQVIDNIQKSDREAVFISQIETRSSSRVLDSLSRFLDTVELFENGTQSDILSLTTLGFETFALQVQNIDPANFNGQTFVVDLGSVEEALNTSGRIDTTNMFTTETVMEVFTNATASIQVHERILGDVGSENQTDTVLQRLSYSVFLTDILFQAQNRSKFVVGSIIASVRVGSSSNMTETTDPILTSFRINRELADNENIGASMCASWDSRGFGSWSSSECGEVSRDRDSVTCSCRQLAHFAILFDLNPTHISGAAAVALSIISYFGLALSLVCLILFILTHFGSKKLRNSVHSQILINTSFALMGLYIFFLIGGHVTMVPALCGISSALLQYFLLVFFAWTVVEAVWLFLNLVIVIGIQTFTSRYILKAGLPSWLVPILVVILSAGPGYKFYTNPFFCRATEWPFWFGMILPFLLMYVVDWILFINIIVVVCKHTLKMRQRKGDSNVVKTTRDSALIAITLATVLGLGWGFGLVATSLPVEELTLTFQILFSIFVGLQGVLIFFLHGIKNPDARKVWKEWFAIIMRRPRFVSAPTTSVTTSRSFVTTAHVAVKRTTSSAVSNLPMSRSLDSLTLTSHKKACVVSSVSNLEAELHANELNVKANVKMPLREEDSGIVAIDIVS